MINLNASDSRDTIRETRWQLAMQIRLARNVGRVMRQQAREVNDTDWRLASAYRSEAASRLQTLTALRAVSRTLRGI